ncbi:ORF1025 [White spot syndrome virus]|uniref:ORF1025 n=1 Tax=White spot syndrome virus TaxID=342409 RepID=A0A2D3I6A7_9VIRU|nr:ORF1025 [White spot syndrome virus]
MSKFNIGSLDNIFSLLRANTLVKLKPDSLPFREEDCLDHGVISFNDCVQNSLCNILCCSGFNSNLPVSVVVISIV